MGRNGDFGPAGEKSMEKVWKNMEKRCKYGKWWKKDGKWLKIVLSVTHKKGVNSSFFYWFWNVKSKMPNGPQPLYRGPNSVQKVV